LQSHLRHDEKYLHISRLFVRLGHALISCRSVIHVMRRGGADETSMWQKSRADGRKSVKKCIKRHNFLQSRIKILFLQTIWY